MSMASLPLTSHLLLITVLTTIPLTMSGTVMEDLANLQPPPDFNTTITSNCLNNPSLRYCNFSSSINLGEIFRFTIVASHLCNESRNPNCVESFQGIDLRNRPRVAPLYLSFDFFWKYCPSTILSIDLSNNSLKGNFPTNVLSCTQIQSLDLSLNELTGDFPIDSFTSLGNLTFLNLSYNHFSESKMSDSKFFERFNSSSFVHSGIVPSHRIYSFKAVILLLGFPVLVVLLVGCFWWLCFQRPDYLPGFLQSEYRFTLPILKAATNGFSRRNLMVEGDHGIDIYKGRIRDGTKVRIEIYWSDDSTSREERRRFVEECKVLVQLRHDNLVRILGWCGNRKLRAIVAEWTDGENVDMWLSGSSSPPWNQRLKVLKGVVEGMCYLQQHWPDVGCDLRTRSVLLSRDQEPLISRFKIGYHDSHDNRIYRFGLLVLEIITNRRITAEHERGVAGLIDYVRENYPENLQNVIDCRMKLPESMLEQAKHGIGLGLMCTDLSTTKHPSLNHIAGMLTSVYATCQASGLQNHGRHHGEGSRRHKSSKTRS